MNTSGNGQRAEYDVRVSEQVQTHIKELHREAAQAGKGQQFLSALRRVHERLRNDPLEFGEPLYRLPALKLVVHLAVSASLAVDYAVHEELPLVFMRGINVLS